MAVGNCTTLLPLLTLLVLLLLQPAQSKSDAAKTETKLTQNYNLVRDQRPLLANTKIYVKLSCETKEDKFDILISWQIAERPCWFAEPTLTLRSADNVIAKQNQTFQCPESIIRLTAPAAAAVPIPTNDSKLAVAAALTATPPTSIFVPALKSQHPFSQNQPLFVAPHDGIFELTLTVVASHDFEVHALVEIIGPHGYLASTDWPLLPFYGIMCIVYVIFGIIWLVVSFLQWRDLLRIQFWIGGVILMGMMEKAFFYAEYHNLNMTGETVPGAELAAEFVSCAKRTLARMLVIIMSLGFGIVKPRLGPMLHRVVGVGALYFILACVESYLRVMRTKTDERNELLVASIPLAVLDTGVCWWIFTSLVQTTRTLRLRRNMVKLTLYRHFTNTLIFSVFASVLFMLYAMHLRKVENCTPGWKDIWIDTAFWHVLFSVLLLVIMILWRPTNNNQRYAFTPLLDSPDDEDEEEEDQFVADAYGVKMRSTHNQNGTRTPPNQQQRGAATTSEEDDLRWVEENIPSAMVDSTLPVLDSDEEIINTKFEVSKMQ